MGMLDGKKLLVTGVLMDSSIAFHVARIAQEEGAEVILTSFGRTMKITQTIAKRLPQTPPVIELDVADQEHLDTLAERLGEHTDRLDGVLHSIGFAPQGAFSFLDATWEDVSTALQISAYSLKSLAVACEPLMTEGGSVVGLTFDAKFAWPVYDWMGVAPRPPSSPPTATSPATWAPRASAATWWRPARSARPRPSRSRVSSSSSACGTTARPSAGTSRTPSPRPRPARSCCPTGSRPRRARSCTSTAASTRWGSDRLTA